MSSPMIARFKAWWSRPPTVRDRTVAAMIGVFAGFWLGLLLPMLFIDGPHSFREILPRVVVAIAACMAIGIAWPRAALLVFLPFAFLGGSGGS